MLCHCNRYNYLSDEFKSEWLRLEGTYGDIWSYLSAQVAAPSARYLGLCPDGF